MVIRSIFGSRQWISSIFAPGWLKGSAMAMVRRVSEAGCLEEGTFADADAIRAALADQLARFKQPRRILFADALPKNAMGKVQNNILRDCHAHCFVGS